MDAAHSYSIYQNKKHGTFKCHHVFKFHKLSKKSSDYIDAPHDYDRDHDDVHITCHYRSVYHREIL
jgi:hypothetical protein